jgi:hypothetical protein
MGVLIAQVVRTRSVVKNTRVHLTATRAPMVSVFLDMHDVMGRRSVEMVLMNAIVNNVVFVMTVSLK